MGYLNLGEINVVTRGGPIFKVCQFPYDSTPLYNRSKWPR